MRIIFKCEDKQNVLKASHMGKKKVLSKGTVGGGNQDEVTTS